jgi:hypothetical protein
VKRRLATLVIVIGLSSSAHAVEWSINSTLIEALELSDNPFMATVPRAALGSTTTVLGNVTGQTKVSRFDFDGAFTYRKYWGPAADVGGSLSETNSNSLRAHYEYFGKVPGEKAFIDASWQRSATSLSIFNDFGIPSAASGDVHTTTLLGGFSRALTTTDLWTSTARATTTFFEPEAAGVQYYDFSISNFYRHQSNSTSALTAQSEVEYLKYDNATRTSIILARLMAGVDLKPFKTVSFVATAGATTVIVDQGATAVVPATPLAIPAGQGVATGFVFDATLTWAFLPTAELTLAGGRGVGPSTFGSLIQREYASAAVRYAVNPRDSLTTRIDLSRQGIGGSQADFLSASSTYSTILLRDWTLDLTYRYQHRGATSGPGTLTLDPLTGIPILLAGTGNGSASSNTFLFVLSHRLVILPKRT